MIVLFAKFVIELWGRGRGVGGLRGQGRRHAGVREGGRERGRIGW